MLHENMKSVPMTSYTWDVIFPLRSVVIVLMMWLIIEKVIVELAHWMIIAFIIDFLSLSSRVSIPMILSLFHSATVIEYFTPTCDHMSLLYPLESFYWSIFNTILRNRISWKIWNDLFYKRFCSCALVLVMLTFYPF